MEKEQIDLAWASLQIGETGLYNENITSASFDKDEPYKLFKEVKELIQIDNDNDNSVLEKIKRIDKILELKN